MKDIRKMTIDEIDNYGSEIQENIKDVSSTILDKTNMISMGSIKESLNEMYDISKSIRN